MESNNNDGSSSGLISYYHPQLRHQATPPPPPPPPSAVTPTPTNGVVVPNSNTGSILYPHSVPSSAVSSSLEGVKRKRGRPRKYGTPEQAAAAKRLSASASSSSPRTRDSPSAAGSGVPSSSTYSSKKSQLAAFGNVGQSFSPHVITVADGEDVNQKIMMFMQQSQREICIISASGSVSNASLRQPATSGGNVTYQGHFDILSLSGSYIRTETGGKTGGLGVCLLSSSDGQIIGGGVGGPLTAAGTIQIIVGTFLTDTKKDTKGDGASGKLLSPANLTSVPSLNFPQVEATHQMGLGSQFLVQHPHPSMQLTPSHSMEWRGNTVHHGLHQSPENGDYDHISD